MRLLPALPLLAAITCLPCCDGRQSAPAAEQAPPRLTPVERGRVRALGDVAAGKLRVYRYGNPASFTNPRTDPPSGLPVHTLLDCCVTAEAREEAEAYNLVMRAAAAQGHDASSAAAHPPAP